MFEDTELRIVAKPIKKCPKPDCRMAFAGERSRCPSCGTYVPDPPPKPPVRNITLLKEREVDNGKA